MKVRMYMAVSVDGFVADADGGVGFLDDFQDLDYGYADFITQISVITMGRKSYDQILTFGDWPYPEQEVLVQTSSPIVDPPHNCVPWQKSPRELVSSWKENQVRHPGDLWVLGGPQLCAAYLEADLIDRLDLYIMPLILGQGLALFLKSGESKALTLCEQLSFDNGVVHLGYERPRSKTKAPFLGQQKPNAPAPKPQKSR
jgi:dihydrofolate reductase